MQNVLQPHLASGLLWRRVRAVRIWTSRPSVVETNVCQSAGKASLAEVGLMAPSHERGFQKSSRALALSACSSRFPGMCVFYYWDRLYLCVFITAVPITKKRVFVCVYYCSTNYKA